MGAIAGILGNGKYQLGSCEKTMFRRGPKGMEQLHFPGGSFLHSLKNREDQNRFCFEKTVGREIYDLTFSGSLYNIPELQAELKTEGNIGELILSSYLKWGTDCLTHLNGAFSLAIWMQNEKKLFLGRDQMGLKPLFYYMEGKQILFASEVKTILAVSKFSPVLDREGAMELIMLGPGRRPGSGILKGLKELEPGCCALYCSGRLELYRYFKLKDGLHEENLRETADHIAYLLKDTVKRQTEGFKSFGTFLSGGLDSSILSSLSAAEFPDLSLPTFSVDYENNDRFFIPGKYQPNSDREYIDAMTAFLKSSHREVMLTPENLSEELLSAVTARGFPGMGDVDSSLLAFCKEVRKDVPMVLSGECADEIFGGYPWFRDRNLKGRFCFPWAQNIGIRESLLLTGAGDGADFVKDIYLDACKESDILPECSEEDRNMKEMVNLNMRFFMQTLVERNERMSSYGGLEVRVPFCDVRIAEYLYKVPWSMKEYGGREKGLLRLAFSGMMPEKVRLRKKSPYPKTFDPRYETIILEKLKNLLSEDAKIWDLISKEKVLAILKEGLTEPWYGQLMKKPQFAAWLLQIDFWLNHYNIELKL